MQEQEKDAGSGGEKNAPAGNSREARFSAHATIERIRAFVHPEWQLKDEDIPSLKPALAREASELERLNRLCETRGAELNRLKAQYADLERMLWSMSPTLCDLRRAGEKEITELAGKKRDLAEAERDLESAKNELQLERERQAAQADERLAARAAKLEQDFRTYKTLLEERVAKELEAAEGELENAFLSEKKILAAEADGWRKKNEDTLLMLSKTHKRLEEAERLLQNERENAADYAQKHKLSEMGREAALKRLEEFEKRSSELKKWREELERRSSGLEKWREELTTRENECAERGERWRKEEKELKAKAAAVERDCEAKKKELDAAKIKMRAEVNELVAKYKKGP